MTAPRNVRPGVTWFVTRRTTRRHFLFSPDEAGEVEQLYWYTTAVYAKKLGIELHMMQLMSSHPHEVLTDTKGVLPRFFGLRNHALCNALKVLRGWPREVLDKLPANWVELPTAAAMVKEMAYTAANCVAAGLVRTPARWPGAKVLVDDVGNRVVKVKRPAVYFDPNNPLWPDEVSIPIVMPPMLRDAYGSDDAAREVLQAEVDKLVQRAHRENEIAGTGYAGRKRVLKTPHTRRAKSFEPFGRRNPTFAAAGDPEVAARMVKQRRTFLADYRVALLAWRGGDRTAVFPPGTWNMRLHHAVACSPNPRAQPG